MATNTMQRKVFKNSIYDPEKNILGISKTNLKFLKRIVLNEVKPMEGIYDPEELDLIRRHLENRNPPILKIV